MDLWFIISNTIVLAAYLRHVGDRSFDHMVEPWTAQPFVWFYFRLSRLRRMAVRPVCFGLGSGASLPPGFLPARWAESSSARSPSSQFTTSRISRSED